MKLKTHSRPSIGPLKSEDGQTVTSDEGMAEILNKAFQEVPSNHLISSWFPNFVMESGNV